MWSLFTPFVFTHNHRQNNPTQTAFRNLLNLIRTQLPSLSDLALFQSRVFVPTDPLQRIPDMPLSATIIAPENVIVDAYNEHQLFKYYDRTQITSIPAVDRMDRFTGLSVADKAALMKRLNNKLDLPPTLHLCIGCPAVITRNQRYSPLANGDNVTVSRVTPTSVFVTKVIDGVSKEFKVSKDTQTVRAGAASISRSQFPIRLGFAKTVHKVQGETITGELYIHVEGMEATPGLAYVGCSRPTDINNVTFLPANVVLLPCMFIPHIPHS
jgi:hypothetical protein